MTYIKYELTLGNLLRSSVSRNPTQVIADSELGTITFDTFGKNVNNLAKGLVKLGVKPKDKVGILDWDTINFLESFYAVPMAGATLHTVNIRYPLELIYYTIQHAEDSYLILRDEIAKMFLNYKDLFGFIKGWIIYRTSSEKFDFPFENVVYFEDLIKTNENIPLPFVSEDDMATIFYTSGTTGMPKGVTFTHRDIVIHGISLANTFSEYPMIVTSRDVMMPLVPMFHVHAWGLPQFFLVKGMKYVLPGRYNPDSILDLMEKEGVTATAMVPSILYMILSAKRAGDVLPKLNLKATIGGGALSGGLRDRAKQFNVTAVGAYGLSETAPLVSVSVFNNEVLKLNQTEQEKYITRAGLPASFVEVKIIGKDGKDVSNDGETIGEIVVRAPYLTKEYYKDPEATKKLWAEGWLHTGDLGYIDPRGYITIVDREKDAVKSGGEFIPTLILEDILSLYGRINEVAVVGRKDDKWGERPVAFYTSDTVIKKEDVDDFLMRFVDQKRIEKFWMPDVYVKVDSFEKGSTGKIDKKILREKLVK
ncbi:MAG: long-chain-fatty-acid--CoA ligase [Cuniculiplasma sp.]